MWLRIIVIATLAVLSQISFASTASAECTTAGNVTVCSMGGLDDEGDSGPYTPYPCRYDYYCNDDWGWFIP